VPTPASSYPIAPLANLKSAGVCALVRQQPVESQGYPDEVKAYKQMILNVAEKAANASKEGGFSASAVCRSAMPEQSFLMR